MSDHLSRIAELQAQLDNSREREVKALAELELWKTLADARQRKLDRLALRFQELRARTLWGELMHARKERFGRGLNDASPQEHAAFETLLRRLERVGRIWEAMLHERLGS